MRGVIFICCALVLVMPTSFDFGSSPAPAPDAVSQAFDVYEQLWRDSAKGAADKLDSGELTTDTQVREFLALAGQTARKVAFEPIATTEQEAFQNEDGWTPEKHSAILRGYVR